MCSNIKKVLLTKKLNQMTKLILFTFFCSLTLHSQNSDYNPDVRPLKYEGFVYLGESSDGEMEYYYKIEKKEELTNDIDVWLKSVEKSKTVKNKNGKLIKKGGNYTVSHSTIHCESNTYSADSYVKYSSKGEIITSGDLNVYNKRIFPETMIEALKLAVCE